MTDKPNKPVQDPTTAKPPVQILRKPPVQAGPPRGHGTPLVAEFTLSFIQALLKTGYYTPGHPLTEKARTGLYAQLKRVLVGHKEISFISARERERRDVMIDGVFDEPTTLSRLMLRGMSETFVPKFLKYFERKHLSSFSVKADITKEEFEGFMNIMSEHNEEESSDKFRERLAIELIKNNIIRVSTIFHVDLVGKERRLPWRVELALTRLKNDLSKIPLYKNLSKEKLAQIKAMVFDDIIRPVRTPTLIKDILINLDLILYDTAGMTKEELEDGVTEFFNKDSLLLAAPELLKEYLTIERSYEEFKTEPISAHLQAVRTITEKVARKIVAEGEPDDSLIMEFVSHGFVPIDELPERAKRRVRRIEAAHRFLEDPDGFLEEIEKAPKGDFHQCSLLVDLLPELLAESNDDAATKIIAAARMAGFMLSRMGQEFHEELRECFASRISRSSKQDLIRIMEILKALGIEAIPVLIGLVDYKNRLVRKASCELLRNHGGYAAPHLVKAVGEATNAFSIRNLLMVMTDMGLQGRAVGDIHERFSKHEDPIVREEAVRGLAISVGIESERLLVGFLSDPSQRVRRKAMWALRTIASTRPEVVAYAIDVMQGKNEEDKTIIEQVLLTLNVIGPHLRYTGALEETLIKVLKRNCVVGRRFRKVALGELHGTVVCRILGFIGSEKSLAVLKMNEKSPNPDRKSAAQGAIERIQSNNTAVKSQA